MNIRMDAILSEYIDQIYGVTRLRRNGPRATLDLVSAGVLAKLEAAGEAMRFVDANGPIRWKATPDLRRHLQELELDAQDDPEDL
jgi:hypothetical protein